LARRCMVREVPPALGRPTRELVDRDGVGEELAAYGGGRLLRKAARVVRGVDLGHVVGVLPVVDLLLGQVEPDRQMTFRAVGGLTVVRIPGAGRYVGARPLA